MPTTTGAFQGSAPVALQLKAGEVKDARKGVELAVQGPAPTQFQSSACRLRRLPRLPFPSHSAVKTPRRHKPATVEQALPDPRPQARLHAW